MEREFLEIYGIISKDSGANSEGRENQGETRNRAAKVESTETSKKARSVSVDDNGLETYTDNVSVAPPTEDARSESGSSSSEDASWFIYQSAARLQRMSKTAVDEGCNAHMPSSTEIMGQ